jgi:site-specific DNA recombinase
MKAAIYTRVSSQSQVEGYSLEAQYESLIKHVENNKWELIHVYSDPGVSAKDLNRPGIQQLLRDIQNGSFEAIVVHKLDRLTRNISNLYDLVELVNKHDVKLISLSENIDTSSPMGRMFIYLLGIFAQMFRENLAEEVVKGMSQRAQNGLRNTSARPYGYNVGENLALIVNDEEAVIVGKIYEWYVSGQGKFKIAYRLNEMGIPSAKGSTWSDKIIGGIISNLTNIGATHWKRKGRPESERIIVYDTHEPIISREIFDAAQKIFHRRREQEMSKSSYDYVFSTILKCGECGRAYHGRKLKFNNYRCSGRNRRECSASDISEMKMAELFLSFLNDLILEYDQPEKVIGKDTSKDAKRLEKLLAESGNRRKRLTRAMADGAVPYDEYKSLIAEENAKIEEWTMELEQIKSPQVQRTRKDILRALSDLRSHWNRLSDQERKQHLQGLFSAIIIKKASSRWNIHSYVFQK